MRKQGFGGIAPNKVESYAEGMVSEHKVQVNHAIGMDITLPLIQVKMVWELALIRKMMTNFGIFLACERQ